LSGFDLRELGWTPSLADSLDPRHVPGRVAAQHRGEHIVYTELGELRARLPGRLLHAGVGAAVGDWVALDGETIAAVLPRRTAVVRNAAGRETQAQVLAANVDVVFVLSSLGPDLELRRLERYLATAWESGATPVVVLTKCDLHPDAAEQALGVAAVAVGVPIVLASGVTGAGCEAVGAFLEPGTTAVLLGSSGVGKSTLANRLAGAELLRTQEVRASDERGRHTTTHRQLVLLPGGGLLVDTPGLRELQLWDAGGGGVERAFADVEELAASCRFADCAHLSEPGCAVLAAADAGELPLDRLRSWRKLQRELLWQAARQGDEQARRARRQELREIVRAQRRGRR
jgi:ribosome biogenesis GTPase / thiamine phosphate phosphatase